MEPGLWEQEWEEATPRTGCRDAERTLGALTLPKCSSQAWRLVDLLGTGGAAGASPKRLCLVGGVWRGVMCLCLASMCMCVCVLGGGNVSDLVYANICVNICGTRRGWECLDRREMHG